MAEIEKKPKKLTPMMQQYQQMKTAYPGAILLYRMGDFYEMFNEDAQIASSVLGLTLTKRNHGAEEPTPLAGFPYHALSRYAHKLVRAGHRIAVCEQIEDPKDSVGIVKRDVVEVITAGTSMDENFLDERANNYIVCLSFGEDTNVGYALCDLSTGEFSTMILKSDEIVQELSRNDPREILISQSSDSPILQEIKIQFPEKMITHYDTAYFSIRRASEELCNHFQLTSVDGIGLENKNDAIAAAGALLHYLKSQKKSALGHISKLRVDARGGSAHLDPATIRNLELLKPLHTDVRDGTLISVLDKTVGSLGSRMMKRWIVRPLTDPVIIGQRLDAVEWFSKEMFIRSDIETLLRSVSDLERVIGRITLGRANARDLAALRDSLLQFPLIQNLLLESPAQLVHTTTALLNGFEEIVRTIDDTLAETPASTLHDGGLIRPGFSAELDEIRDAATNGKNWIAQLQQSEREKTGIETLKVGYNKVFGYFLEVTKTNIGKVPPYFIRKQTLVNGERYITPELKDMEATVLGAQERLGDLEFQIFCALRENIAQHCEKIQHAAEAIAILDVLQTFGDIAVKQNYCRPVLLNNCDMHIIDGRHPVVEQMMQDDPFVANDTTLVTDERQILLITGPNMAGKSTYLRQNALIALMAQIGCFVPAREARIGIVDHFFTRIGASDRLARGQSTFLVEMIEVANILNNATDRSLVLLDEVGRGTSTFDGVSIAWAVAEFLHNCAGKRARTFFATHYHELTELEAMLPRVVNLHISVREWNDTIIFLRKIVEGGSSHSYGIQVASLAGVPLDVVRRAQEILQNLEGREFNANHLPNIAQSLSTSAPHSFEPKELQLNLFDSVPEEELILEEIRALNVPTLTPLEALNILSELQTKLSTSH